MLTTRFATADGELAFFSMFTTVRIPQDITLASLRVEHMFAAEEATHGVLKRHVARKPPRAEAQAPCRSAPANKGTTLIALRAWGTQSVLHTCRTPAACNSPRGIADEQRAGHGHVHRGSACSQRKPGRGHQRAAVISRDRSKVKVRVVRTNEEAVIAQHIARCAWGEDAAGRATGTTGP